MTLYQCDAITGHANKSANTYSRLQHVFNPANGLTNILMKAYHSATEPSEQQPELPSSAHVQLPALQANCLQTALASLDRCDVETVLSLPCRLFRSPPHFLKGCLRKALQFSLELVLNTPSEEGPRQEQTWKLWMFLPRLLLRRPPNNANVPKPELLARFEVFFRGNWEPSALRGRSVDGKSPQAMFRTLRWGWYALQQHIVFREGGIATHTNPLGAPPIPSEVANRHPRHVPRRQFHPCMVRLRERGIN